MSSILYILIAVCSLLAWGLLYYMMGQRGIAIFMEYRELFTQKAQANMSDMFMFTDTSRMFYANVVAMILIPAFVWLLTGDLFVALVLMGSIAALPQFAYRIARNKRLKKFQKQLPDALAMISGSLRAGASLSTAIDSMLTEMDAPISQEFELFQREQKLGADFETAIRHMEDRVKLIDFQLVVSALRISREVGGNLTEVMDSMADTLRKKAMMEGKIQSLTAQGKMQGLVMTGLPILIGGVLMLIEPEAMGKMFNTEVGWITLAVIIVMEALGFFVIKKITTIDV